MRTVESVVCRWGRCDFLTEVVGMVAVVPEETGDEAARVLDVATGGTGEDTETALDVAVGTGDEATPFEVAAFFTSPTVVGAEAEGVDELADVPVAFTEAEVEAEVEASGAAALVGEATGTALELGTGPPPTLAHAKLIFVTKAPVSFGALRSHVISTYGQHTLSDPTFAISPLTNTDVDVMAAPTFAPLASTSWKEVPA
jgi:hypothetical protein